MDPFQLARKTMLRILFPAIVILFSAASSYGALIGPGQTLTLESISPSGMTSITASVTHQGGLANGRSYTVTENAG
jgi:hypothetical protein